MPMWTPGPEFEAQSPADCSAEKPWEAAEEEAAQGAGRGRGKGKGQGCVEARGAPMRLQEQASTSHSPFRPFLWGIHAQWVKMASG